MYWSAACWIILFHLSQVIYSSFAESQSADCVSKPALQWINPGQNKQNGFSIYLEGEWHEFDCRIANTNVSVNVTLWRKDPYYSNDPLKQIPPDGKHIAIKEKNVFRLPRLLESDSGRYYCKACQMQDKYVGGIIVYKGFSFARPNITIMPCCMSEYDYGSNVTLKCVIPAYRTLRYNMSWFKLGSTGQEIEMGSSLICCKHDEATLDLILSSLTKKDEGTYWCRIKRRNFEYSARKTARIIIKESIPNFSEFFNQTDIIKRGGERLSFNYKVSSNPEPNITWWKSKDGKTFESVASCANGKNCEADNNPQMQITRSQFSLINITYPEDNNVLFKCQAKNVFGNVSKSFLLIVYAKPQIVKRVEPMGYYKDMQINCTVKEANPSTVNFTWHSCDQTSCSEARWREISRDSSLTILRPEKGNIKYRCTAKNSAGVDQAIFEVIFPKQSGPFPSKSIIGFPVLIAVGSLTIFTLCIVFFVLWKRKRIYGGFYIFSYPPLPDYIEQIDVTKDVQEQFQKLPFIPEWEFPRERITLLHVLGRGEFGCVWLAHAIGISDFRPRDILKQKTNRRRLTVFFRNLRRNNYIFYKDTIRIAVKKLKENWDRSKLVDLQTELKVLIHVGEHENIVNVLGACTKGQRKHYLVCM